MTPSLANATLSALVQLAIFGAIPLLAYAAYQVLRHKRGWRDIMQRAGLKRSPWRHVLLSAGFALASVVAVVIWRPSPDIVAPEGSALHGFIGLGLGLHAVALAVLYAVIKTGLTEEILFRGLIAGSLSRRLPLAWANLAQATIFALPHLLILTIAPDMWVLLPIVFATGLVMGWIRMTSGSIIGPWLIHASTNLAMALSIVVRTSA